MKRAFVVVVGTILSLLVLVACAQNGTGGYAGPNSAVVIAENQATQSVLTAVAMQTASAVEAATRQHEVHAIETASVINAQVAQNESTRQAIALERDQLLLESQKAEATAFWGNVTAEAEMREMAVQAERQLLTDARNERLTDLQAARFRKDVMWVVAIFLLFVLAIAGVWFFISSVQHRRAMMRDPVKTQQVGDGQQLNLLYFPHGLAGGAYHPVTPQRRIVSVAAPEEPLQLEAPRQQMIKLPDRYSLPRNRIGLGVSTEGPQWFTQGELSDMMIVGNKGSGKSSFLRMLAYQAHLQGWALWLADAEGLTFAPHIWGGVVDPDFGRVATSVTDVVVMLEALNDVFNARLAMYRAAFERMQRELPQGQHGYVEDLPAYNQMAQRLGLQQLQPMMILFDEANSFLAHKKEFQPRLTEILRRSRKPGATVGMAAHEWHAVSIPSQVRGRLDRRISFKTDFQSSKIVLGSDDGARIDATRKGFMLMAGKDGSLTGVQTFYVDAPRVLSDVAAPVGHAAPEMIEAITADLDGDGHADDAVLVPVQEAEDGMKLEYFIARCSSLREVYRALEYDDPQARDAAGQLISVNARMLDERVKPALEWRVARFDCHASRELLARAG